MKNMSRTTRVVIALIVFVLAVNIVLSAAERLIGGAREGDPSSSFNTGAHGLAAYADLLQRAGHPVVRLRGALADERLDPRQTLVVLDAEPSSDDVRAIATFVKGGGVLICGGLRSSWLRSLVSDPPSLAPIPLEGATPVAPVPEVSGVSVVRSNEPAVWVQTRSALPVLGVPGRWLLAVRLLGAGRIDFLASASPLQNDLLPADDDAAFGLALAGGPSRTVAFAERSHGFSDGGFGAIPRRGRYAILALFLAGLVFVGSRVRRLGPAMRAERPLPPPRRLFVSSLAQALGRTRGRRGALAPLRAAARDGVARVASLPPDAKDADIEAAAIRIGLDPDAASAIVRPPESDADVVAAGRAYVRLRRKP